MAESDRDFLPAAQDVTEYMVPGPGMGTIRPWAPPDPAEYSTVVEHDVPSSNGADESEPPAEVSITEAFWDEPESESELQAAAAPEAPAYEPVATEESPAEPLPIAHQVPSSNGRAASLTDVVMPLFLRDELVPILESAQRAALQMIERSGVELQHEREELERARQQLRVQEGQLEQSRRALEDRAASLVAWHSDIAPIVRSFQAKMQEINSRIDEVPDLIRTGLSPLASTVSSLNPTISEMTAASNRLLDIEPLAADLIRTNGASGT